jgi:hypothetical protein
MENASGKIPGNYFRTKFVCAFRQSLVWLAIALLN